VPVKAKSWMAGLLASCSLGLALPAAADITVVARYTLVGGDTLTRASYYSPSRTRVTAPDGREFIYDSKSELLTVINHRNKTYWTGPIAQADTIADSILIAGRRQVAQIAAQDREAWMAKVQSFNDSIQVTRTERTRDIAGYPTALWQLSAGSYLKHERWVARSLAVVNYGPELEKAVMASVMDPLGRELMRMLIDMRSMDGLPLAAKTTFRTLSQSGSFDYEAIQVIGKTIPATAWEIPAGYRRIKL